MLYTWQTRGPKALGQNSAHASRLGPQYELFCTTEAEGDSGLLYASPPRLTPFPCTRGRDGAGILTNGPMMLPVAHPCYLSRASLPATSQGHVSWRTGHTVRLPGVGHPTCGVCRWLQGRL